MPQGLGMFAQNWTLLTEVCDSCNKYFGRELDLQISRDSIEAYLRIASGLKPARAADNLMHRRMKATLLADGLFDGVRVLMKPTDKGDDMLPVPAAQVGFRRPGQDRVFLTEREWSREAIAAASAPPVRPVHPNDQRIGIGAKSHAFARLATPGSAFLEGDWPAAVSFHRGRPDRSTASVCRHPSSLLGSA